MPFCLLQKARQKMCTTWRFEYICALQCYSTPRTFCKNHLNKRELQRYASWCFSRALFTNNQKSFIVKICLINMLENTLIQSIVKSSWLKFNYSNNILLYPQAAFLNSSSKILFSIPLENLYFVYIGVQILCFLNFYLQELIGTV